MGTKMPIDSNCPSSSVKKPNTTKKKTKSNKKEQLDCAICLDNLEGEFPTTKLKCKHEFHFDCITEAFKRKKECPLCRSNVKTARQFSSRISLLSGYKLFTKEYINNHEEEFLTDYFSAHTKLVRAWRGLDVLQKYRYYSQSSAFL